MEIFAYNNAMEKGYIHKPSQATDKIPPAFVNHEKKAVHMSKIFDMMAGTSTGSILAAGLAKPDIKTSTWEDPKPRFWTDELVDIYKTKGD